MKAALPPNELYAAYALFPANVPMVPYPDLPEVERKRWEFAASVVASRLHDAFAEGRNEATGLTPDGIAARDKAREREHAAAKILDELCEAREAIRQAQKRVARTPYADPDERRVRRTELRFAKEQFNSILQRTLGAW